MMEQFNDCGWMPMMWFGMLLMALFWVALIVSVVPGRRFESCRGTTQRHDGRFDSMVDPDYEVIGGSGSMLMVNITGTAVQVE